VHSQTIYQLVSAGGTKQLSRN